MIPALHQLLRLCLTLPITLATSERTCILSTETALDIYAFVYDRKKAKINNCLPLHIHKDVTDSLNITLVATEFIGLTDECHKHFGHFK